MTKAVFLDRDGVINADIGYLWRKEDFVWIPGAPAVIRRFNSLGWRVLVVTNQSGVARGYYSEQDVQNLHDWINKELAQQGAQIDAFYYCPHHPRGALPDYTVECDCRKPKPGLIRRGMADWNIEPADSILIGDKESDLAAAQAAGITGYLFLGDDLLNFMQQQLPAVFE